MTTSTQSQQQDRRSYIENVLWALLLIILVSMLVPTVLGGVSSFERDLDKAHDPAEGWMEIAEPENGPWQVHPRKDCPVMRSGDMRKVWKTGQGNMYRSSGSEKVYMLAPCWLCGLED